MIVKILGCGTSTGVPIPGCECPVCSSNNPKNSRTRTSALISPAEGLDILIDTTTDLRHQALRWGVKRISAVLFTHSHADHILGLDDLRGFNFVQKAPIPCYAAPATLTDLKRIFYYAFEPSPHYKGGLLVQLDFFEFQPGAPFSVQGVTVQPVPLLHGDMPVTGFRIGDLAYLTDCSSIPADSYALLKNLKCLVLDGLRYKPHKTHFTIPQALDVVQELQPEMTYLTHMTHSVDYDEVSAQLPSGVALAYDGLEISV